MEWLSTAFTLLACAVAVFSAWRAATEADAARESNLALRKSQAKLAAHEISLDNLSLQFRRLNGRMNAYQRRGPDAETVLEGEFEHHGSNGLDPDLAAELAFQGTPLRQEPPPPKPR